jgi:hypothetical protein
MLSSSNLVFGFFAESPWPPGRVVEDCGDVVAVYVGLWEDFIRLACIPTCFLHPFGTGLINVIESGSEIFAVDETAYFCLLRCMPMDRECQPLYANGPRMSAS